MKNILLIVLLAPLAACGLSNNTKLADLEEGDQEALCAKLGDEETFTCDMGAAGSFDFTVGCNPDDLEDDTDTFENNIPDSCEATVGDLVDCYDVLRDALAEDACLQEMPPECDAYMNESCAG